MKNSFELKQIGTIRNTETSAWIEVNESYAAGLKGLEQFSHILVFYWFHENDKPENRNTLEVHPCHNAANPLTGVFATHSPARPNLIAITRCRMTSMENNIIHIDGIDALDNSPLIDIKSYFPWEDEDVRYPNWEDRRKT
ncbi:MAG: tRNA (N6-threonylcarbamoyladenosine(37)-N6)-methyltransferase TrmO [Desulfobacteraceae bacterium]|nr:tRNA (N6-threonylcarbamoyladenosine(37)-N6)-methyltransferase TrmO [Desulfobacteraceae bacterium]